jgi:hypothetical protein
MPRLLKGITGLIKGSYNSDNIRGSYKVPILQNYYEIS